MDRYDRGFRRQSTAPIKVGDTVEVTIEAVGEKGDGLAKISGFVIFVPGVKQGEKHMVKITRVLRSVAFAEVTTGEATKKEASTEDTGSDDNYTDTEASSEDNTQEDSEDF